MAINDPQIRNVDSVSDDDENLDEHGNDLSVAVPDDLDVPDESDNTIEENEDGTATVSFSNGKKSREVDDDDFMENLAEVLDDEELETIARTMLDAIDRDCQARKARDEQYAEGIKRTGLGDEAPGGADFEGASRAVHPVLMQGCIEFAARSMKELFPPSGPVKTHIIGTQTDAKLQKAERKKQYMNWQLTKQIREYRAELEQTLTQTPLAGSEYLKVWHDDRIERPRCEFIALDNMIVPFAAADFDSAERKTHRQKITQAVYKGRVDSKLYRDVPVGSPTAPEETAAEIASNIVEGKEDPGFDTDGLRTVYESYCELEVEGDELSKGAQRGYILTIDETSRKVVGLYRNWDQNDKKKCPDSLDWIVEFGFIPWRGAYKIGLAHIVGGLSAALTGSLRAILDSAHISQLPSGLIMSHARQSGKNIRANPTELVQITAPPNVDDIRKLAMAFPYPGPSNVLFQLMDWLTNQARGIVTTANEAIKDAGSDMPVGTALALIEQGSITFSSVHARLHASQARVLNILHRINRDHVQDNTTVEELGELVVNAEDFQGPVDIMPVSDPNIFSEAQRYAQNQAAIQLADKFPQVFKVPQLVRRALMLMNYPGYDEILAVPAEAKETDCLTENIVASDQDSQLKVFPVQDHMNHLKVHIHFMSSPIFCANPMMALPALPKLLAHVKDHLLQLYKQHVRAASQVARHRLNTDEGKAILQGAAFADQELAKELAPLMPLLTQAQQLAQKLAPPPPADPRAQAQLKIASDKLSFEEQNSQAERALKLQLAQGAAANDNASDQRDFQLEQNRQQAETERNTQEMAVADRNATLAAEQEQARNDREREAEDKKELFATVRQILQTNAEVMAAEIKAGHEANMAAMQQDFQSYSDNVGRQFESIKTLLGHGVALETTDRNNQAAAEQAQISADAEPTDSGTSP